MLRLRRFGRLVVALATAALLVSTLGVAVSTAADSRDVRFTFGTGQPDDDSGALFSSATAGGRTAVTVTLENAGGQTLNHVAFAGGAVADGLPYNPLFPKPAVTSLPDGSSFAAIFPAAGCSLTGGTTNAYAALFCEVGQLTANSSISYLLVLNVPATAGNYDTWLTASWSEGWSTTGMNADYTFAEGSFSVGANDCTTATASYFLPGENVDLTNGGGTCQDQEASIASGDTLEVEGIGGFASLGIDDTFAADCPSEIHDKCFGVTVEVSVLGGVLVPGGVQWTVKWYGVKSLSGVIHFGDDYATDPTDYTSIPFTKKLQCVGSDDTNCWVSKASSKGNEDPLWFEATFITPDNGRTGGYS